MDNKNEVQNEDINAKKNGLTKLHKSCIAGLLDDVTNLLAQGADVKIVDTENDTIYNGKTGLHFAAENNYTEIIKVLLNHDITIIDIQNNGGFTALQCAAFTGNVEATEVLLKFEADTERGDKNEWKPLHTAASAGHNTKSKMSNFLTIVELLLNHRANLESTNLYNDTPLHIAFFFDNIEIAAFLFVKGANLNAADVISVSNKMKTGKLTESCRDEALSNEVTTTAATRCGGIPFWTGISPGN
ncbi:putative ankyrin repeat protein RF_0580 [Euwallacea similis]|uniref:putative ankyrin repeat protein RF_0580 n=1 Tax=Euwallacea similis TaxID=1736056 RepID=UPI00344CF8C6